MIRKPLKIETQTSKQWYGNKQIMGQKQANNETEPSQQLYRNKQIISHKKQTMRRKQGNMKHKQANNETELSKQLYRNKQIIRQINKIIMRQKQVTYENETSKQWEKQTMTQTIKPWDGNKQTMRGKQAMIWKTSKHWGDGNKQWQKQANHQT